MTYLIEERIADAWTYADLEGEPSPQTLNDAAKVLDACALNGVHAVRVTEVGTGKDVTENAIAEFAHSWPTDMPQPDFLTDSWRGQQIMRGAV